MSNPRLFKSWADAEEFSAKNRRAQSNICVSGSGVEGAGGDTIRAGNDPKAPGKSKYRNKKVCKPERDVLRECLSLLAIHPKVAFAYRVNTGGVKFGEQWVKFGIKGQADITGMLKDGRRLEVECKRVGKYPSPEQNAFLFMVNKDGGFACHVDSVDRLALLLEQVET